MSLMDWFFPEQAEAMHLRRISESMRGRQRTTRRVAGKAAITEKELRAHIRRVDEADGVADGKLTPDVLRGALGLARQPEEPKAPTPTRKRRR